MACLAAWLDSRYGNVCNVLSFRSMEQKNVEILFGSSYSFGRYPIILLIAFGLPSCLASFKHGVLNLTLPKKDKEKLPEKKQILIEE